MNPISPTPPAITDSPYVGATKLVTGMRALAVQLNTLIAAAAAQVPPPVASFTATVVSGLQISVNGSASTDADGSTPTFGWDFGDAHTGTGATTSHTYQSAGTYPITLTVTDPLGQTATMTRTVTVTAPTAPPPATFTYGVTKPDTTNTGVGVGGNITPTVAYTGTLTPSTSITIRDKVITGIIKPSGGATVTLINCIIKLTATYTDSEWGLYVGSNGHVIAQLCEIYSTNYNVWICGAGLQNMTLDRCDIHDVVDGIDFQGASNTVKGCYIHDLLLLTPDSNHPDNRTHCDGIQITGGDSIVILGNNVQSFASPHSSPSLLATQTQALSCIMLTPNAGPITNLQVTKNWFDGGYISINGGALSRTAGNSGAITDNRFGRNQGAPGHTIDLNSTAVGNFTVTGNVYEDNGTPVTVRWNA